MENSILSSYYKNKPTLFISHRSLDKDIVNCLFEFFIKIGMPRDSVFCSSLPGNDVKQQISDEVKNAIQNSCLNIAVLSNDYYQSAYCLNEAGILWFQKTPVIIVALPEIDNTNMVGFLDSNYKIRRLDNDDDIAYIYDNIIELFKIPQMKAGILSNEFRKIKMNYCELMTKRNKVDESIGLQSNSSISEDEKVVLYYLVANKICKSNKAQITKWMAQEEIYNINIDSTFLLLGTLDICQIVDDTIELKSTYFRKVLTNYDEETAKLLSAVKSHIKPCVDIFKIKFEKEFTEVEQLFVAYIIDQNINDFGDRWRFEYQIRDIESWEKDNKLDSTLSNNYSECLQVFIENKFVYESDWTSYGNPKTYTLSKYLKELLFNELNGYNEKLLKVKNSHIQNEF